MTTYNYWCTNGCHTKNIQSDIKELKCDKCNKPLKVLGEVTNIAHIGTQESNNKR